MKNQQVVELLHTIADLLDISGEDFFKTRAYRIAAQNIDTLQEDIERLVAENRVTNIAGVGDAIAKKITEYVQTGSLQYYDELKKKVPETLLELLEVSGLGPKKVAAVYQKLGVTNIDELQKACEKGKVRSLDGFGEITERNILRAIALKKKTSGRVLLNVAYQVGSQYLTFLTKCPYIEQVSLAGSLRRMKETIGDIDILASSKKPDKVMEYFVLYDDVQRVLLTGSTKTSVLLNTNINVDLRVVEPKSYGAALQYFTGSKEHNVSLRGLALKQGYTLSEYGLFTKDASKKFVTGKTEHEIYAKLGLNYIEPELRENRGEIDAAANQQLPYLVELTDVHGDFHIHSEWSDGNDAIETIVQAAKKKKYSFIAITDHSQSLHIANGLTEEKVQKKIDEIRRLSKKHPDIRIFCGTECDIKNDGSLDYSNKILKQFDIVYIGIHSSFKMNSNEMTQRIIKGMENEHADFLAHPTGRLLGRRDSYEVDIEQLINAAHTTNTHLEINSFPDRLDLQDIYVKHAKEQNVTFVLGTDAHSIEHLDFMRYGVATARRGWLEKDDILNTYSISKIEKILSG